MIRYRRGIVTRVHIRDEIVAECVVNCSGDERNALTYIPLVGDISCGDEVIVNTVAVDLKLGTGGWDFISCNVSGTPPMTDVPGHIIKLRYTPGQLYCRTVDEQSSPDHEALRHAHHLDRMPVVICSLHSQIAPAIAGIKQIVADACIGYVMTDSAALPLWLSKLVPELKKRKLISETITTGQAFGGDRETVTVYTGLLAARWVADCDAVICGPGPGHVGTGTVYGFSGIEQGQLIDVVNTLAGTAVSVVRMSFADTRARHRGVSHHTLTVLGRVAHSSAYVAVPEMDKDKLDIILHQLQPVIGKHKLVRVNADGIIDALQRYDLTVTTMGRTVDDDREFFLAAGAAGITAGEIIQQSGRRHGGRKR